MNQTLQKLQLEQRYNAARASLLSIVIFSVVNLFTIPMSGTYFLFSAYVPQMCAWIGYAGYLETGMMLFPILYGIYGIISLMPYFLCWIFSKKRVAWMIAALVLFSIESIFLLRDIILYMSANDFSSLSDLLDLLFHIIALATLIQGVIYGVKKKKSDAAPEVSESLPVQEPIDDGMEGVQRILTISRAKKFIACGVKYNIFVNDTLVGQLGNGDTVKLPITGHSCIVGVISLDATSHAMLTIPAGYSDLHYTANVTMSMKHAKISLEPTAFISAEKES